MKHKGPDSETSAEPSPKKFSGRAPLIDLQNASVRIAMVFCDSQLEHSQFAVEYFLGDGKSRVDAMSLSQMLKSEIRADMLILCSQSPDTILAKIDALHSALTGFRQGNPGSAVVIVNLYGKQSPHGALLHELEAQGIGRVIEGPVGYMTMIDAGLEQMRAGA